MIKNITEQLNANLDTTKFKYLTKFEYMDEVFGEYWCDPATGYVRTKDNPHPKSLYELGEIRSLWIMLPEIVATINTPKGYRVTNDIPSYLVRHAKATKEGPVVFAQDTRINLKGRTMKGWLHSNTTGLVIVDNNQGAPKFYVTSVKEVMEAIAFGCIKPSHMDTHTVEMNKLKGRTWIDSISYPVPLVDIGYSEVHYVQCRDDEAR